MHTLHYIFIILPCVIYFVWSSSCPKRNRYVSLRYVNITNSSGSYPNGTTLQVTCRKGYIGRQIQTVTCVNGNWTVPNECQKRRCSTPADLLNGWYTVTGNLYYGSVITYTCNTGYQLLGSPTSSCLLGPDGRVNWTPRPPICEITKCKPPPTIANGTHTNIKEYYTYLDAVTYSCNDETKLTLTGPSSKQCSETGRWVPDEETKCEFKVCKIPQVANGHVEVRKTSNNVQYQYVNIKCDKGFRLQGETPNMCKNGVWFPALPTCEKPAPPRGDMPHIDSGEDTSTPSGRNCNQNCTTSVSTNIYTIITTGHTSHIYFPTGKNYKLPQGVLVIILTTCSIIIAIILTGVCLHRCRLRMFVP
ncbi:complement control protein homolog ccph [Ateline gammaherpesvirus 3]|uniref:Complement control protein homolog ccph n=1 Tax=Ateline herpesvirus 3 TaxID=85618 RepID=Q9YTQ8_ATHV3|nr:complement control protein homolog ccph [Ateline gammaherpesvirus 3]AAC95530.1 complement control protein homolog ccph [Ateline gammaherpesvirus 3]